MQRAGRRLAAARFADQAQRLAGRDLEADAVDRMHLSTSRRKQTALDREVLDQIRDAQQRRAHRGWRSTSRSQDARHLVAGRDLAQPRHGLACRPACANLQRGAKRQPGGGSTRLGTTPGIASRRVLLPGVRSMRGIERIRPCV